MCFDRLTHKSRTTVYRVIFEVHVLNFHVLPKIELLRKIKFMNDQHGHIERCGMTTLLQN